ncbi:MAG: hypothetical protein L0323_16835 [Planctomycetes bacterium]|nr:hypothetical protein [Planctomycetota bacterium]
MHLLARFAPVALLVSLAVPAQGQSAAGAEQLVGPSRGAVDVRRPPVAFIENRGQWGESSRFVARSGAVTTGIEAGGLRLALLRREEDRWDGAVVRLAFEGACAGVRVEGKARAPGSHNFLLGAEPSRWRVEVPAYESVLYRGVHEGIDVRVRHDGDRIEYDLLLAEGADLDRFRVRCEGAGAMRVGADGALVLETPVGEVRQPRPAAWVVRGDRREPVECSFRLLGGDRFGFSCPAREPRQALVVDPGIVYSTYVGASGYDEITDLAVDASGGAILVGRSNSMDLPATPGAFSTTSGGGFDAFAMRLSPTGGFLVYATYLGGSSLDEAYGVAVDPSGAATVVGKTWSANFPATPGAFSTTLSGLTDGFVARLLPTGAALSFATFLGGAGDQSAVAVGVDSTGSAIVAMVGANFFVGGMVLKLSPSGSTLLYSTSLDPPSAYASAWDLAVAPDGKAYVAGGFFSSITWVKELSVAGAVTATTPNLWYGVPFTIALDPAGGPVVAGSTSGGIPTTPGAFDTTANGGSDAFVARFTPSLGAFVYSTYLGGIEEDEAYGVDVDSSGAVTVAGHTESTNFPVTPGAFDTAWNGGGFLGDAFVTRLSPSGASLRYSTFFGGATDEEALALALDSVSAATIAGRTAGPYAGTFPVSPGALSSSGTGAWEGFAARLDMLPAGATAYGVSTPGCAGPLAMGLTSMPQVGNAGFGLTCTDAPSLGAGILGISLAPASPPFFVGGVLVAIDPTVVLPFPVTSNAVGASEVPIPIPANAALGGLRVFAQFFWPSPCAPGGVSGSNALSLQVQP